MEDEENRRCDYPSRERLEELQDDLETHVDKRIDKAINGMLIVGIACVIALILGGISLKKVHDESNHRIDSINDSRLINTVSSCVASSSQNGVIQNFILFATGQDKSGKLYTQAVKVFPVKKRTQCEKEASKKVGP